MVYDENQFTDSTPMPTSAQPPLPFQAAIDYDTLVSGWAGEVELGKHYQLELGVQYGSDEAQSYDVFYNKNWVKQQRFAPILVFWHGGGWTNGYTAWCYFMAQRALELGFVFVVPSYRLAPQYKLDCAHADSIAALAHIAQNAFDYGGHPKMMVLAGHSAGGHLAALLALKAGALEAAGIRPRHILACMPISGIMDLHHAAPPAGSLEERVYSMVLAKPEDDVALSPINHTENNEIRFDLTVGELDSERVRRSNAQLLERIQGQRGRRVELHTVAGASHFDTHTALYEPNNPWWNRLKGYA